MASILRVRAQWQGFQGAPGYNLFHFGTFPFDSPELADAQSCVDRTRAFYNSLAGYLPSQVSVLVQPDVDVLDPNTGELQNVFGVTAPLVVNGSSITTASFASAVGAVVGWRTSVVKNNRRIRGRTFIVPLSSTAFQTDGTLLSSTVTGMNAAATTFRTSTGGPGLGVYARISAQGASDGVFAPATANTVPDLGAVLRSRRN